MSPVEAPHPMNDGTTSPETLGFFAEPRLPMLGPYLIRNPRSARIIRTVDRVLTLLHPNRSPPAVPAQPRRILVADWAHLGNVLLAIPTLRLLRSRFPAAEIGFLTGSWSRQVLEGTGLCDHIHVADHFIMTRRKGSRAGKIVHYLATRRRAVAEMRGLAYDVAIDVSCNFPPVSPLFYAAGIPIRSGFTSGGFGPLLTHPVRWVYASRPISDYPRDLLQALWPGLSLPPDALAPCYPGQPTASPPRELAKRPYVILQMGSGAAYKEWLEPSWTSVAAALADDGHHLVFPGSGANEAARIQRVTAQLPAGSATILADRRWPEYVATVAGAMHMVCLDSVSAHLAAAFSVPTTAIYAGVNNLVQWGPCNRRAVILTLPVGCAPCCRRDGCAAMACIRGVTPERVIATIRAALTPARAGA